MTLAVKSTATTDAGRVRSQRSSKLSGKNNRGMQITTLQVNWWSQTIIAPSVSLSYTVFQILSVQVATFLKLKTISKLND